MNVVNNEKVIVILTDGMDPGVIRHIDKAQKFFDESASTLKGRAVVPAITMPCHMSLFKSVEPTVHQCMDNDDPVPSNRIKGICEVLNRRDRKCAMFYGWGELRDLAKPGIVAYSCFINEYHEGIENTAKKITKSAKDYLSENFTSFAFVHYDIIDVYGHWHGWMSDKYIDGARMVWDEIYDLIEIADENTTIIVVSDHSGHENDHSTEQDTPIPVMIKSKFIKPGTDLGEVSIKDIAPTVCKILEVEPDPEWEGKALF